MPSNTTYNPPNINSLTKNALLFDGQGVTVSATAGQTTNLDYTLTDDCLITGTWIITNGTVYGDRANFQIVDTTGMTGLPAGTVLNQFATNWYLPPAANEAFEIIYPAKIIAGLTLRLVYTSTGSSNVNVFVNYALHKVLV